MLARRAGLLDWDRRTSRWALVGLMIALLIGAVAQRAVPQDLQAADCAGTSVEQPV